jgi:hypothetical protein
MANKKTKRAPQKRAPKKQATVQTTEQKSYKYQVEKNIQLVGYRTIAALDNFPFSAMQVGDSFLIPKKDVYCEKPNGIHYAAKMYARMIPGFTVTSRLQLDGARRVWRIK